jgi:phosphatidylserine/phosphatidylglycerophosphate/cardiolipin synthase-like enzyme
MDTRVIGMVLVVLMVGVGIGYFLSFNHIVTLQSQINAQGSEITILTSNYHQLNTTYNDLFSDHAQLEQQVQYEIDALNDQDYYYAIKNDLQKANETIQVAMYSMVYDPPDSFDWANDLIRELVNAQQRGVSVSVIIENRTYFGSMSNNLEAYDYLSINGIDVRADEENDTDHMKLVIIDGKIVYVGSHNWSESALYYNHETSVKILSDGIAETFIDYFTTI